MAIPEEDDTGGSPNSAEGLGGVEGDAAWIIPTQHFPHAPSPAPRLQSNRLLRGELRAEKGKVSKNLA